MKVLLLISETRPMSGAVRAMIVENFPRVFPNQGEY